MTLPDFFEPLVTAFRPWRRIVLEPGHKARCAACGRRLVARGVRAPALVRTIRYRRQARAPWNQYLCPDRCSPAWDDRKAGR